MFYQFIISDRNDLSKHEIYDNAFQIAKNQALNYEESSNLEVFLYKKEMINKELTYHFVSIHNIKEINIKEHLYNKVLNNQKSISIRKGVKNYNLGDSIIKNINNKEEVTPIFIKKLKLITYNEIDNSLAHLQGYSNKNELKNVLLNHYPNVSNNDIMTVVFFALKNQ